ncbi:MFS transporter [Metarhizium robertsii]|uniref:MFS transporter n=1 Tax=Metarhizium robertsii TaxID=568076 RepID=A0A014N724_9HYPO|nr:MFS transporter [Metarhizium robertsii]
MILSPVPSSDPDQPLVQLANMALSIQPVFWNPMTQDLGITYQDLANAQAIQLVGLASSCILFIPLTKKYGRRSTYVFSTALVAASSWWTAYMTTKVELYLTSLLYGLAASTTDTSVEMSRATANGIYAVAVMGGSFLTPMIAGVQAEAQGWRVSYMTLASFMTAIHVIFIFFFEENKWIPTIEGTQASTYTTNGKIDLEAAPSATPSTWQRYRHAMRFLTQTDESLLKLAIAPVYTCFMPHVVFGWLQLASGVCWLVVLSSVLTIVFAAPPYNFNPAQVGYMYTGPTIGTILSFFYGGPLTDWAIVKLSRRRGGVFEAEMRLYPLILPAIVSTGGLIMFGATADRGMHYIYPSIGGAMFAFGFGSTTDISLTMVLDAFPLLVGQTFVAITFFRCAISIIGPFTITPWLDRSWYTLGYLGKEGTYLACAEISKAVCRVGGLPCLT